MNNIIRSIEQEQLRSDIPDFRPGDTVRVDVKVVEGNKELEKLIKKCGFIKDYLDKTIISKRTKDVITLHSYIFVLDK